MHLLTFARWLARKDRKALRTEPTAQEIEDYHILVELMKEAWEEQKLNSGHAKSERMSLARKAVIAEIRDKGRKVSSIAPEEIQRLTVAYLREHLEENTTKTFVCF